MASRRPRTTIVRLLNLSLCLALALSSVTAADGCDQAAPAEPTDERVSPLEAPLGPDGIAPAILELLAPADTYPLPSVRDYAISEPLFARVLQGLAPRTYLAQDSQVRRDGAALVAALLASGAGEVTLTGPWYEVWPRVLQGLAGRPVLQLYYGRNGNAEEVWVARLATELAPLPGLPADGRGRLLLDANALYLAPAADRTQDSWLISTAAGRPDAGELSVSFCLSRYTRTGPVVVIKLDPSAELARFARTLSDTLSGVETPPGQEEALTAAREAAAAGRWEEALHLYGEALRVGAPVLQSDPAFLLDYLHAWGEAGSNASGREELLLTASCLAEEQGRADLLAELEPRLEEAAGKTDEWPWPVYLWRRLTELRPADGKAWWQLAAVCPDALPAAERVAPPGSSGCPGPAAALFLRRAGTVLRDAGNLSPRLAARYPETRARVERAIAEAESWLVKAKSLDPENPYATYLEGVIAGTFRDDPQAGALAMWAVLAALPGQPEAARQLAIYEATRSGGPRPAETYQFLGPAGSCGISGGALWSPDGRRLAVVVSSYAGPDEESVELALVDRATTTFARLSAGRGVHPVAWSPDGQWLYYIDGGLKSVAWDGRDVSTLAPSAHGATLSPDGLRLAFWSDGIWVVNAAGGPAVRVTPGEGDHGALWFSDSRRFLYAQDTGTGGGDGAPHWQVLAKADASAPGGGEVVRPEPEHYAHLVWLVPDEVVGATTGWDDAFSSLIMHLDGAEVDLGWREAGGADAILWLPGTGAAAVTMAGQGREGTAWTLHIFDCDGSERRSALLAGFGANPNLTWVGCLFCPEGAPASTFLIEFSGPDGSSLWALSPEKLKPRLVAVGDSGSVSLSPDGAWVAVFTGRALDLYSTASP